MEKYSSFLSGGLGHEADNSVPIKELTLRILTQSQMQATYMAYERQGCEDKSTRKA
jgi:hypothetical protein